MSGLFFPALIAAFFAIWALSSALTRWAPRAASTASVVLWSLAFWSASRLAM